MNTLRLYCRSMAMLIKSQLQYPLSFLMQTLAQLVMEGGELLAVILLIDRFDRVNQWGPGDLYFFFGLMSVSFYLTEIFGRGLTGNFPSMVRNGQLDTLMLRPRGILTQVLCSGADPRRIACIAVGTVSLIMGSRISAIAWSPLKVLMMAESIFFSFWLILGLFMVEAILTIHTAAADPVYGGGALCAGDACAGFHYPGQAAVRLAGMDRVCDAPGRAGAVFYHVHAVPESDEVLPFDGKLIMAYGYSP